MNSMISVRKYKAYTVTFLMSKEEWRAKHREQGVYRPAVSVEVEEESKELAILVAASKCKDFNHFTEVRIVEHVVVLRMKLEEAKQMIRENRQRIRDVDLKSDKVLVDKEEMESEI